MNTRDLSASMCHDVSLDIGEVTINIRRWTSQRRLASWTPLGPSYARRIYERGRWAIHGKDQKSRSTTSCSILRGSSRTWTQSSVWKVCRGRRCWFGLVKSLRDAAAGKEAPRPMTYNIAIRQPHDHAIRLWPRPCGDSPCSHNTTHIIRSRPRTLECSNQRDSYRDDKRRISLCNDETTIGEVRGT